MKKWLLAMLFLLTLGLFSCSKNIYINLAEEILYLPVDNVFRLNYKTNDKKGLTFRSLDESILTIDNEGEITSLSIGKTAVEVISITDKTVKELFYVTVLPENEIIINKGNEFKIPVVKYSDPKFNVADSTIVEVNKEGVVKGLKLGTTTITISSTKEPSDSYIVTVNVVGDITSIGVDAPLTMIVSQSVFFKAETLPKITDVEAIYESLTDNITVDEQGLVTALAPGSARIRIRLKSNPSQFVTHYFEIISQILVDKDAQKDDILKVNEIDYRYGETLFPSISEAIENSIENTKIIVNPGLYEENIKLVNQVKLISLGEAVIKGDILIASDDVMIKGFTFEGNNKIYNEHYFDNIEISNNNISSVSNLDAFITLNNIGDAQILDNNISANNLNLAIKVQNFNNLTINFNTISNVTTAIEIINNKTLTQQKNLNVMWNKISDVTNGIKIDVPTNNLVSIVRFNELDNYTKAVISSENHNVDYNLNYWGEEINLNKFDNLSSEDIAGYYMDRLEIIDASNYNPSNPVKIEITNIINEIDLEDEFAIEYKVYPKEADQQRVAVLLSDPLAMEVDGLILRPLKTMDLEVTLRSTRNTSIRDTISLSITTAPSIELKPSQLVGAIEVGDNFDLQTTIYPYQLREEKVLFDTSNENIAVVDEFGKVTAVGEGLVIITAELATRSEVNQTFTFQVYQNLDTKNNPLDFVVSTLVLYTTYREWNVFGVNFDYTAKYMDSISRILVDDIEIDQSKMIPEIYPQIRPGGPRPEPKVQTYNEQNVVYVVVHETANTNEGGGALMHANYLWNEWQARTEESKSWHFTVDDKEIYQHIPTDEMAWHAGDGRRVAGDPFVSAGAAGIGGGNANGIGIETSVAIGDHIFKIWQRTARLAATLSKQYNLPYEQHLENVKFHNDFSGKSCPQSMIKGGNTGLFYEMVSFEYTRHYLFEGLMISIESNDPEYLRNDGQIIKFPEFGKTISYNLTVEYQGNVYERTVYTYLPGKEK